MISALEKPAWRSLSNNVTVTDKVPQRLTLHHKGKVIEEVGLAAGTHAGATVRGMGRE